MSLEEKYTDVLQESKEPLHDLLRLQQLEEKVLEQEMLLKQQQKENALLWKRVGIERPAEGAASVVSFLEGEEVEERVARRWAELKDAFERGDETRGQGMLVAMMNEDEKRGEEIGSLDALTQLPNRKLFNIEAGEMLSRVREYVEYQTYLKQNPERSERRTEEPIDRGEFSIIMFDLDHFKRINDAFGHAAGDTVLVRVADVIRSQKRAEDVVSRYGGEEFIVAIRSHNPGARVIVAEKIRRLIEQLAIPIRLPLATIETMKTCQAAARTLADQLGREPEAQEVAAETGLHVEKVSNILNALPYIQSWEDPTGSGGGDTAMIVIRVTASIGTAKWHLGEAMGDIIQTADMNLYEAKKRGRNRIVVDGVE